MSQIKPVIFINRNLSGLPEPSAIVKKSREIARVPSSATANPQASTVRGAPLVIEPGGAPLRLG